MRTWFLNHCSPHYATVIVIHVSFVSHSKLSPKASSNSRWKSVPRTKESTFKSAMRAAAPSGISKNSSWPIWAFEWNDGRMDGHCNIYISTYNIHIHINIHIWVYLLRWICGEIIAWVLPKQNVAVDIVNVNILIKVPPWNSDFQWFSLIFTGLGQAPIVANQNFQRHGKHDLSRLIFRKDSLIIMNHHKGF